MKFLVVFILSIVFISQVQGDQAALTQCIENSCANEMGGILSATQEQVNENYKLQKCHTGQKSSRDEDNVAVDVTQDEKCKIVSGFPSMGDCIEVCAAAHLTGDSPYIQYYKCSVKCMRSISAVQIGYSLVLLAIVIALL